MALRNGFLRSWQKLSTQCRTKGLKSFAAKLEGNAPHLTSTASVFQKRQASYVTSYDYNVQLYSYYNYLYYYPTMSWNLHHTPETDDYWVGIYRVGAPDNNYITYQWVNRTAQGSYKIGRLPITNGSESRERSEEFELRLFKGDMQRVDAVTNVLRGTIASTPVGPPQRITDGKEFDTGTRDIIAAIQKFESPDADSSSLQYLVKKQWDTYTPLQKRLLLPVVEQEALPDKIKKPDPKALNRQEPKRCFPKLGKAEARYRDREECTCERQRSMNGNAPVLTVTLNASSTYIYPVVNVVKGVYEKNAWMGMYYSNSQSDGIFDPKHYIDNDWQWVGTGQEGSTELNYIEEYNEGPTSTKYLGVIFKGSSPDEQIGLAGPAITAEISTTENFNKSDTV